MSCTVVIKDKNLKPENIKMGITILKVTGTFEGGGGGGEAVLEEKTVNSSTLSQEVLPGEGFDGLSKVTVEPYTLDSKTVNSSTSQQTVTSSADGLSSVTVNAVTSSIDSNIQADNIKKDVTILGVTGTYESAPTQPNLQDVSVTYVSNGNYTLSASEGYDGLGTVDVSVNVPSSGGSDWLLEVRSGNISDLSSHELSPPSTNNIYYSLFERCKIDKLPDMSGWTSISGESSCRNMFKDASSNNSGDKIADLSSLTTLSGSSCVQDMFNGSKITELRLPNLSSIDAGSGLQYIIGKPEASTLKTLKINVAVAQPYGMTGALTGYDYMAGVENVEMTGMARYNLAFDYMTKLTAASVLNILNHLGTPITSKRIDFASGLTVTDFEDGRIQTAYNAAVADGWTINNLTITPFS